MSFDPRTSAGRLLAGAALALAACAGPTAPDARQEPVDVPPAWSGGGAAAPRPEAELALWWQQFDDPQLAAFVDRALQANPRVNGAQAALRQAQAQRAVAAAALWPTLGATASAQRGYANDAATGNRFQLGLDAQWNPDLFGGRRSALAAGDAAALASDATLGDVQVQVAAEVALDFILLRSAQARLAIAESNLASQRETLQITQWREQAGLVTALDVQQARAASEQTAAQLPLLRTSIAQTTNALAVLVGDAPSDLAPLLADARPVPQARATLAAGIPAETLRQRADVRAAEHQVTTARARVGEAEAARWPSFALGGTLGLSALTLGTLADGASVVGSLLASVALPLVDGGARRAQVRAQEAALDQAHQAWRAAVLGALREVEDALAGLHEDRERQARLREAADAARQAAELARQRYGSGLVDFQAVLETQRTQLGAQDTLAAAGADLGADHVRLYKALGGGWRTPASAGPSTPGEPR